MREIKYRAWEKSLKEIIPVHEINFESKMINTKSAWRLFDEIELMQYTGLKDKNGKEIYEGDVLKGHYYAYGRKRRFIGKVVYGYHGFWLVGVKQYMGMRQDFSSLYEVIGNSFEKPELLEGVQ
ncbi:YopX family protein [Neobacillus mesonae]|uniref:YopX family protein n=1 Tax=Neobacillus mesonae TaxID=1193713 RepID=UPI00203E8E91|nr:YopX family protein [Neobacillus mesonae]MCM3567875.1 YopX family protein [Neobacillus mesonae]